MTQAFGPDRVIVVAREIARIFEFPTLQAGTAQAWVSRRKPHAREFVLIVEGYLRLLASWSARLESCWASCLKQAVQLTAAITDTKKTFSTSVRWN